MESSRGCAPHLRGRLLSATFEIPASVVTLRAVCTVYCQTLAAKRRGREEGRRRLVNANLSADWSDPLLCTKAGAKKVWLLKLYIKGEWRG